MKSTLHCWFSFVKNGEPGQNCSWRPCNLETCMWRWFCCCQLQTWFSVSGKDCTGSWLPVKPEALWIIDSCNVSVITSDYSFQASPQHYRIQITNSWIKPFFNILCSFSSPLQFLERETAQRSWKADDMDNSQMTLS